MLWILAADDNGLPNFIRATMYASAVYGLSSSGQSEVLPFKRRARRNKASMRVLALLSIVDESYKERLKLIEGKEIDKVLEALKYKSKGAKVSPYDVFKATFGVLRDEDAEILVRQAIRVFLDANEVTKAIMNDEKPPAEIAKYIVAERAADLFGGHGIFAREMASLGIPTLYVELNPVAAFFVRTYLRGVPEDLKEYSEMFLDHLREKLKEYYDEDAYITFWARLLKCKRCGAYVPYISTSKDKKDVYNCIKWHDKKKRKPIYRRVEYETDEDLDERPFYKVVRVYQSNDCISYLECPRCGAEFKFDKRRGYGRDRKRYLVESMASMDKVYNGRTASNLPRGFAMPIAYAYRDGRVSHENVLEHVLKAAEKLEEERDEYSEYIPYEEEISNELSIDKSSHGLTELIHGGIKRITQIMTPRQLLAYAEAVKWIRETVMPEDVRDRISTLLAKTLQHNVLTRTESGRWGVKHISSNQSFYLVGTPAEITIPGRYEGSFTNIFSYDKSIVTFSRKRRFFQYEVKFNVVDDPEAKFPDEPRTIMVLNEDVGRLKDMKYMHLYDIFDVVFMDPPYTDMIPYWDLSFLYYARLKKIYGDILPGTQYTLEDIREFDITDSDTLEFAKKLAKALQGALQLLKSDGFAILQFAAKRDNVTEIRQYTMAAILAAGFYPLLSSGVTMETSVDKPGKGSMHFRTMLMLLGTEETAIDFLSRLLGRENVEYILNNRYESIQFDSDEAKQEALQRAIKAIEKIAESLEFGMMISNLSSRYSGARIEELSVLSMTIAAALTALAIRLEDESIQKVIDSYRQNIKQISNKLKEKILNIYFKNVFGDSELYEDFRDSFDYSIDYLIALTQPGTVLSYLDEYIHGGKLKNNTKIVNILFEKLSGNKTNRTNIVYRPRPIKELLTELHALSKRRSNTPHAETLKRVLELFYDRLYKEGSKEQAEEKLKDLAKYSIYRKFIKALRRALEKYYLVHNELDEDEHRIAELLLEFIKGF